MVNLANNVKIELSELLAVVVSRSKAIGKILLEGRFSKDCIVEVLSMMQFADDLVFDCLARWVLQVRRKYSTLKPSVKNLVAINKLCRYL